MPTSKKSGIIRTTDVGSFPLSGIDSPRYFQGAQDVEDSLRSNNARYFTDTHNAFFQRKLVALGPEIGIPCFVQSSYKRDMLSQYLDPVVRKGTGLQKQGETIVWDGGKISLPQEAAKIAEVIALKDGAKQICEALNIDSINYKICVTGPFEMMTRLWSGMGIHPRFSEPLLDNLTKVVETFVQTAFIKTKYLHPAIITLEEPSIGVTGIEEIFIDAQSDRKLTHLISCWNRIYAYISKDCYRGLHIHASPYTRLFEVDWNLLEAHVGAVVKKQWLEEHEKFIRVAVLRTDGPFIPPGSDPKRAWERIHSGDYQDYLQPKDTIRQYLRNAIQLYGFERIPFAGPECGLGSWDWKFGIEMTIDNLTNLSQVVREFNSDYKS